MQELLDLARATQYRNLVDYIAQLADALGLGRPLYVYIDPSVSDAVPHIAQIAEAYEDSYVDGWSCTSMLNTTDIHIDACTFCDRVDDISICAHAYERWGKHWRKMRYELKIEPASGARTGYISFVLN